MAGPTSKDGFRIRNWICEAAMLRHYHPQLFESGVIDQLIDLSWDYAGASDHYTDLVTINIPGIGDVAGAEPDPDEHERRADALHAADVAFDFAIADVVGSQVWGAFSWVEGPEWLLGPDDDV
jgi:hypothetical protein